VFLALTLLAAACSAPEQSPSASVDPTTVPTSTPIPIPSPTPSPSPEAATCPLNGLPVTDAHRLDDTALLVQIENHPQARPPANLGQADLVIEAPVEGDVTRYSAVFLCQATIGLTGPIRSARYYNIDLWQDVGVLTVSFGASNGALVRFREAGMPIVNGIFGQWPFFPRGTGIAPHNLYGDLEELRNSFGELPALDQRATQVGPLHPPFLFAPGAALPAGPSVGSIRIQTNSYWVFGWNWDPTTAEWHRIDGGAPITDRATGAAISARSVVIQRVRQDIVYGDPDPGGNARRYQHLVGSGDAVLYLDGRSVPLRWSRPTESDHTTWTVAETGDELVLPPGEVWWEIVPLGAPVTIQ
jgi:hypothetical protein